MSMLVQEICYVVNQIKIEMLKGCSIQKARRIATHRANKYFGVEYSTISDKYSRKLNQDTKAFEIQVLQHLKGSTGLKQLLLSKAVGMVDVTAINSI